MSRFISICLVLLTLAVLATQASAEPDPMRVLVFNASERGGNTAYRTIRAELRKSDDVQLEDEDRLLDEASIVGLSKADLRSSRRRDQSPDELRAVMRALDLEALLIVDVYARGRKFQLVAIDPTGREVSDERTSIRRWKIKRKKARNVLKRTFQRLVPEVRSFRDQGGWDAVAAAEARRAAEAAESAERVRARQEREQEQARLREEQEKRRAARLGTGLRLYVGPQAGSRNYSMRSPTFDLEHRSPWVGIGGRAELIYAHLGPTSALGLQLHGAWAPFTTVLADQQRYSSAFTILQGDLGYHRLLSETFGLELFAGIESRTITVKQNSAYTGNEYLAARVGLRPRLQIGLWTLGVGLALLPSLSNVNSSGAYGDPEGTTYGFEGSARIGFAITESLRLDLDYSFKHAGDRFLSPTLVTDALEASDNLQTAQLALGIQLF